MSKNYPRQRLNGRTKVDYYWDHTFGLMVRVAGRPPKRATPEQIIRFSARRGELYAR